MTRLMTPRVELGSLPSSVPLSALISFVESLGIDPHHLPADEMNVVAFGVGARSINVAVFALDESGNPYLDDLTGSPAVHSLSIPVVDDREQQEQGLAP